MIGQSCSTQFSIYNFNAVANEVAILLGVLVSSSAFATDNFAPFTNEAAARGLNYLVAGYGLGPGVLGSGLCAADLDGDGNTDIVAMGKASGIIGVFRNIGDGVFVAQTHGIAPLASGASVAAGDYDSDGDLDLAFSQMGGPVRLYRHDRPFAFVDVSSDARLTGDHAGRTIAWTDADGDGRIDILLACYTGYTTALANSTTRLWRNLGNGAFADVTLASGLGAAMKTFVVIPFDFDHDGDPDLYFSNDRGHLAPDFVGNRLYRNDGGSFVDVSTGSGANLGYFSMGAAVGDLDADGWMDIMTTNFASENQPLGAIHPLFISAAVGLYEESSAAWGVGPIIPNETGWATHFLDADNDGLLDLLVNNQTTSDRFFHQTSAGSMQEVAARVNLAGSSGAAFCSVVADFNGDGALDILSNHAGGNLRLLMNNEGARRTWLSLRVRGVGLNRDAIGARVVVTAGGHEMARQVLAGGAGYLGMSDSVIHVGCNSAATAAVHVWWPNTAQTRTLINLPTSAKWTIYPPSSLGDGDHDTDRDAHDLALFDECVIPGGLREGCEMFDFDGNSALDARDRALLQQQILHDACDLNGDGIVSAVDLAFVLSGWGSAATGDIDASGTIDAVDLAYLLANWG